jgi:DNA-binding LacI/PurR family transcriptional regulator
MGRAEDSALKTLAGTVMLLVRYPDQMSLTALPQLKLPQRTSLITQTAHSLRESLHAGHWQGHLPGERELVKRLKVSRQTLRAALDELKREGLLEVDSRQRRRIRLEQTHNTAPHLRCIAVLSARPLSTLSPSTVVMLDSLRDHLSQLGFSLEIHVSPACFSASPARALEALTARAPAAAWLLLGSLEQVQNWFLQQRLPCLVVGSCSAEVGLASIDTDYRATCRHAGGMLRRKGHRCIALIRPAEACGGETSSEQGLREALGGEDAPRLLVLRHNGSATHLCTLLDKALRSAEPPTACIVGRAHHVLTTMMFLQQRGLRIPEDVAVISRDDETFLQHAVPGITRYETNSAQFARRLCLATRRLAETGTLPPSTIRLMPKLVRSESF